jgi:hypothetical protein
MKSLVLGHHQGLTVHPVELGVWHRESPASRAATGIGYGRTKRLGFLSIVFAVAAMGTGYGADADGSLESLKRELEDLRRRTQQLEQKIQQWESERVQSAGKSETGKGTESAAAVPASPAKTDASTTLGAQSKSAWSPAAPITLMRAGSAYLNLSLATLVDAGASTASDVSQELLLGGHDPNQRGFSMPNTELALDGAVDPYFKGFANVVMKLDQDNATEFELEEAYLMTTSLPANLQVKAGQFFAEFGRQNSQHPHQWAFVDQPIALNRMFGPDGLRNPGARLSWLAPTPWYLEVFLGVFNGQGETAFSFRDADTAGTHGRAPIDRGVSSLEDLLYVPRVASSLELSDSQTIMVGASGAFGANSTSPEAAAQIYGADVYWKWKSDRAHQGFPFVSVQSEFLYRDYEAAEDLDAGLPDEMLHDWGVYGQVLWGFRPRWITGMRAEYAHGNQGAYDAEDVYRGERFRWSPNLTWHPSEFSKIRLQYNLDQSPKFDDEHSVWLQVEVLLGAHAAHKF